MSNKECECLSMYSNGYEAGKAQALKEITGRADVVLTEDEIDAIAAGADVKLQGYWALTIFSPYGYETFSSSRWRALVDALVINSGVKVTTLKFDLNAETNEYKIGLWEN